MKRVKLFRRVCTAAAVCLLTSILAGTIGIYAGDDRTEGGGFGTPEEAVSAYIEGLCNGDIRQMLSACAVESYVEGYDLEASIERTEALMPVIGNIYLPAAGKMSEGLNLETRKQQLVTMIKIQYLTLCGSKMLVGEEALQTHSIDDGSAEDLIREYLPVREPEITFSGEILPPVTLLPDKYFMFFNQRSITQFCSTIGAEQLVDRVAVVYVDGKMSLVLLGVICYNGNWYVTNGGYLANMLGLPNSSGGAVPLYLDEENRLSDDELAIYLSNPSLLAVLNTITQELENIDMKQILSLDDMEAQEAAYEEEMEKAISRLPSQDQEFIEQFLDR